MSTSHENEEVAIHIRSSQAMDMKGCQIYFFSKASQLAILVHEESKNEESNGYLLGSFNHYSMCL